MNTKPLYITLAAVLVFGAWLFRYEVTSTGSGVVVYRLDQILFRYEAPALADAANGALRRDAEH